MPPALVTAFLEAVAVRAREARGTARPMNYYADLETGVQRCAQLPRRRRGRLIARADRRTRRGGGFLAFS